MARREMCFVVYTIAGVKCVNDPADSCVCEERWSRYD